MYAILRPFTYQAPFSMLGAIVGQQVTFEDDTTGTVLRISGAEYEVKHNSGKYAARWFSQSGKALTRTPFQSIVAKEEVTGGSSDKVKNLTDKLDKLIAEAQKTAAELKEANKGDINPETDVSVGGQVFKARRHKNPDGRMGGYVATSASVAPGATVAYNAFIGPRVEVMGSTRVLGSTKLMSGRFYNAGDIKMAE